MYKSKDHHEFMNRIHRFNQEMHKIMMKMVEILNIAFDKILEGLKEDLPIDAEELELVDD